MKTISVTATLTKKQQNKENNNMYFCTFRGAKLAVAGNKIKFDCAENITEGDILKVFLKEDELESLEITINYKY